MKWILIRCRFGRNGAGVEIPFPARQITYQAYVELHVQGSAAGILRDVEIGDRPIYQDAVLFRFSVGGSQCIGDGQAYGVCPDFRVFMTGVLLAAGTAISKIPGPSGDVAYALVSKRHCRRHCPRGRCARKAGSGW